MTLTDSEAREELELACRDNEVEEVLQLFASGSVNADDATAALKETDMKPSIIRILLHNGADPSAIYIRQVAFSVQAREILSLLDEFGYNFETEGHLILQDFALNREMLDWLLDRGVNVNMTDHQRMHDGFNLYPGGRDDSLHHLNIIAADGDIDLFDHLVSRGADPLKSLALHSASENEDPEKSRAMVRHLLDKHKMDINSNNEDFRDFFHDASDTGSPLCNAVLHRNLGVVLELLERGARIMSLRANAVRFAVKEGGFFPALKPLLRAGANPTEALTSAVCHMNFQAAQLCLDFGADPAPALHRAIEDEERR